MLVRSNLQLQPHIWNVLAEAERHRLKVGVHHRHNPAGGGARLRPPRGAGRGGGHGPLRPPGGARRRGGQDGHLVENNEQEDNMVDGAAENGEDAMLFFAKEINSLSRELNKLRKENIHLKDITMKAWSDGYAVSDSDNFHGTNTVYKKSEFYKEHVNDK